MSWQRFDGDTIAVHFREYNKVEDATANQPAVMLLHGWPDSPHTWYAIAPVLADAGFRVITPFLRGFGPNHFHSDDAFRSGQLSAIAHDILQLADHLGLATFSVVGHDWGARCAYILAALYPERIQKIVAMSVGYEPGAALNLKQTQNYWYQWYMATPLGEARVREQGAAFCEYLWQQWAPNWRYSAEQLTQLRDAISNPDWAAVTIHSYTQRWGHGVNDPACAAWEQQLKTNKQIRVTSLLIHGSADTCNDASTSENLQFFDRATRVLLPDVGHYPQHEAPAEVLQLIQRFLLSA